jgi:hypothetical protein
MSNKFENHKAQVDKTSYQVGEEDIGIGDQGNSPRATI